MYVCMYVCVFVLFLFILLCLDDLSVFSNVGNPSGQASYRWIVRVSEESVALLVNLCADKVLDLFVENTGRYLTFDLEHFYFSSSFVRTTPHRARQKRAISLKLVLDLVFLPRSSTIELKIFKIKLWMSRSMILQ